MIKQLHLTFIIKMNKAMLLYGFLLQQWFTVRMIYPGFRLESFHHCHFIAVCPFSYRSNIRAVTKLQRWESHKLLSSAITHPHACFSACLCGSVCQLVLKYVCHTCVCIPARSLVFHPLCQSSRLTDFVKLIPSPRLPHCATWPGSWFWSFSEHNWPPTYRRAAGTYKHTYKHRCTDRSYTGLLLSLESSAHQHHRSVTV